MKFELKPIAPGSTILGFVGLGLMGSRIARRLIDHGFELIAYDRDRAKLERLIERGASPAISLAEVASSADVILSSLTDDEAVRQVYTGPTGLFSRVRPNTIIIEMSTVSPDTPRELNRIAAERGAVFMDVAISGSTPAAERGTLTLLGGGEEEAFHACVPIWEAIAKKHFHLGPVGCGATMKLAVNLMLGVGMQAMAEAVAFGLKAGLDRERFLSALSQTAVVPPALVNKLERAFMNDYSPQFPLRLMNKDFRLILQTAAAIWTPLPATAEAFQINLAESATESEEDFSAVIRFMEKIAHSDAPIELRRSAAASA